jgi:tyrosyl-tRNA synthetase
LVKQKIICSSKREANDFIKNNAVSINGKIIKDPKYTIEKSTDGEYVVIRKGKKSYFVVIMT